MKQRIGICTNFGNCSTADHKKKVPITGGENFCPTCGSQLTEYKLPSNPLAKLAVLALLLVIIFGGSLFIWQRIIAPGNVNHDLSSPRFFTGSTNAPSDCLLEHAATDNRIVQAQQMLPMTYVPAVNQQPIPRDIHPWMKQVAQVTEAAFFIMRREVTVGEFKRYVITQSEAEKIQLGYDWQQDRNGVPLPDDYPVGSIPWEAAQGYAEWLSQKTQCHLTLPTYSQWVSATVQYAQPDQAITRQHQQSHFLRPMQRPQLPETVMDLLGNLREWSLDSGNETSVCPAGGHYILGEDYKTWLQYIGGEPTCETMALDTIGFRLVRLP